ncbi:hypothetical protein SEVIR_3G208800v4 [Setaria viridis]|uniref:WRKY domain-containing protein n=1 Tax=Setaria viridis TaxID=4556 RepID=A0A4U6VFH7_SETVI|nr:probable WRKY transcription factor 70 [Setaria viridis]TKW26723.1 hypothetical protein SEVIR_3G208800v2 [Setaria viridis]
MAMASAPAPVCAALKLVARGRESAAVLQTLLLGQQAPADGSASAAPHGLQELTNQILRCCDRALAALRHSGTEEEDADAAGGIRKRKPERGNGAPAASPARASKRMRMRGGEMGTRVEKRATMEDGFIWRKYGQKEIHGSKYPRFYFRCTYKEDHGCTARRQVQRWEADPSLFLITYFGDHTCCRDDDEPPAPFVINFSSSSSDGKPSGSPWPSCDGDGLVVSKTPDLCNSPEESEFVDQSTSVPELTRMSSMEWDSLLDGCLDWMLWDGESSFDIIGDEFIGHDIDYLDVLS